MADKDNYVLGKGEIWFAPFKVGTQVPRGERYFGNTPEFALTIEAENLEHYSSDRGIREKDDSVVLETTRSGSLTTDNIAPDNVALFFFGQKLNIAIAATTVTNEALADVEPGLTYQLGAGPAHPAGHRGLVVHTTGTPDKKVIVMKGVTELVEGTDYTIDMTLGRLTFLTGGAIVDGDDLTVSYKVGAQTRERIISGSSAIEGAMRFIARNPKGKLVDYFLPWVKITPNGDYALKGDEWQQIPFNIEALRKSGFEAIYADGRPLMIP